MYDHDLRGCTPTPLAAYLKALAVLRLVAEQGGDPKVQGFWRNDVFVLRTALDQNALIRFFLDTYQPTPLVAPWNGGSGFYPKDNRKAIETIAQSSAPRFAVYRDAITLALGIVSAWSLTESPKDEDKRRFVRDLRNQASEALLRWMDAAIVLSDDSLRYPPLLGTGGNDGRLDFTNNFMQRLVEMFDTATGNAKVAADELLRASLLNAVTASLSNNAIGQFAPGAAGGPNANAGFEGDSRTNPWDFILMLEGAVLLAASAVRRLEASVSATLSAPFTVRSRAGTVGSAAASDDDQARGEVWMPLWDRPFTAAELSALFAEGRAALGRRAAQDGLDFARAVARLGVDRGIKGFQRYGFLMRSGKAFLATPLARVAVHRNPQADLIDDIDRNGWLSRVQRLAREDTTPHAFRALAWQLDAALFALTQRRDRLTVQRVLRLLGRIEALAGRSPKVMEQLPPVPSLSPSWRQLADDDSTELRIARALAGLSLTASAEQGHIALGLRSHLAPLALDGKSWNQDSRLVCWTEGPLERNLVQLLHRRRLEAIRLDAEGECLRRAHGATLGDVHCFLRRETDDTRIAELAHGLACIERDADGIGTTRSTTRVPMPPVYAMLKPFFASEAMLRAFDWLPPDRNLRSPAEIPARLASDDVTAALRLTWQRLRALGKKLPGRSPPEVPRAGNGPRLLAALMIPLAFGEMRCVLDQLDLESEDESEVPATTIE